MKTLNVLLAICVIALAALNITARPAEVKPERPDADFGVITAQKIVVTSKDGKRRVIVQGLDETVGIWVDGGGTNQIAIVADPGNTPFLGFNHPDMLSGKATGCPLAFSVGKDGMPLMQVRKGDSVGFVQLTDLLKK